MRRLRDDALDGYGSGYGDGYGNGGSYPVSAGLYQDEEYEAT